MLGKLIGLVISLLVWGASGYLAGKLLQGEGYGLLGNILLGLVGGFVGSLLVTIFGITGLVKLPFIGGIRRRRAGVDGCGACGWAAGRRSGRWGVGFLATEAQRAQREAARK